mmetsp:Transcript_6055/g.13515  ORF Transcript_6055/g.13515 Transcript_6055/m.13515 type:complete len:150 (+) Transcript_6055:757-1206(+)
MPLPDLSLPLPLLEVFVKFAWREIDSVATSLRDWMTRPIWVRSCCRVFVVVKGPISLTLRFITELLWLHVNQLSGAVPHELGRLEQLTSLRLEGNHLSGLVPEAVCDLRTIYKLEVFRVNCDGSNPDLECTCCDSCSEPDTQIYAGERV